MTHMLITLAASFAGTLAALAVWRLFDVPAQNLPAERASQRSPRSRLAALMSAAAFAGIAALIVHLISIGQMVPGLGAIAALVALMTLGYVVRVMR